MIKTGLIYVLLDKCIDVAFSVASENMKIPEKQSIDIDRMRKFTMKMRMMFGLTPGVRTRLKDVAEVHVPPNVRGKPSMK